MPSLILRILGPRSWAARIRTVSKPTDTTRANVSLVLMAASSNQQRNAANDENRIRNGRSPGAIDQRAADDRDRSCLCKERRVKKAKENGKKNYPVKTSEIEHPSLRHGVITSLQHSSSAT